MSEAFNGPVARPLIGVRLLVIDDSADDRRLATFFLERAGAEVTVVDSGEAGLAASTIEQFDAIVCDLQMPGMDGIETTRQIRGAGFDGPVIAWTGAADDDNFSVWLQSGCDTFIEKPTAEAEFVDSVTKSVERARLRTDGRV